MAKASTKKKAELPESQLWPADKVERVPISSLVPYARNARTHSAEQVDQLAASMREWGWTMPVLRDEHGGIIAGHGRVLAAKKNGYTEVPCMTAVGWSEAKKKAYVIADNKLALNAGWDIEILKLELDDLSEMDFDMDLLGFTEDELANPELLGELGEGDSGEEEGDGDGDGPIGGEQLAKLTDITIAEPKTQTERGQIYKLGRHLLCVMCPITDWKLWVEHLNSDDTLFCPYPGIFVPMAERAADHRLMMVQSDTYIAGHIVDRWNELHPTEAAKLIRKADK